jgi:hypothetical protein
MLAAVLTACGSTEHPATPPSDLCSFDPESCPFGTTGTTTTTSANIGGSTQQQGAQRATETAHENKAARERSEDEGRARAAVHEPHAQPVSGHGGLPPHNVPHPINTGDPCGPCNKQHP